MKTAFQLKRCPFCNGHNLTMDISMVTFNTRCFNCGASGPDATTKELAVKYWNGEGVHQNESALVCIKGLDDVSNRDQLRFINL